MNFTDQITARESLVIKICHGHKSKNLDHEIIELFRHLNLISKIHIYDLLAAALAFAHGRVHERGFVTGRGGTGKTAVCCRQTDLC